jgi:DNA polymerase-3 subunit epsilon
VSLDLTKPWREYPIVSCDFETTGPDPLTCEPVEVSCVRFSSDGTIIDRFTSLLRTKAPIPEEATKVHGITDEMVDQAPSLEEVADKLMAMADGAVPLAFNRGYDRTVMHRYLNGTGVTLFDPAQQWLCALAMVWKGDRFVPGQGRHKLAACCERRGINVVGAHRAEADAIACGMLFFTLMANTPAKTTMGQVLERVAQREAEKEADYQAFRKKAREADRVIWRQYAAMALAGFCAQQSHIGMQGERDRAELAAIAADEMLAREKEYFK